LLDKRTAKHYNQYLYQCPKDWDFSTMAKYFDKMIEDGDDIMIHAAIARNLRIIESVCRDKAVKFTMPDTPFKEQDIKSALAWAGGALTESVAANARLRRRHAHCVGTPDMSLTPLMDEWVVLSTTVIPDVPVLGKNYAQKVGKIPVKDIVRVPDLYIDGVMPNNPYPFMARFFPKITQFVLTIQKRISPEDKLLYAAIVCYFTQLDLELFLALSIKIMYDKVDVDTMKATTSTAQQWVAKHRPEWDDSIITTQLHSIPEALSSYFTIVNKTLTSLSDSNFVLHNSIITRGVSTASGFYLGLSEYMRSAALTGHQTPSTKPAQEVTSNSSAIVSADSFASVL